MKFINRYSHKAWNDKSGQTQIRLLNYLFGFIIVLSFWSIGQVVNSPSGEAWGNILRIGQLPIWLTMGGNNNNNNFDWDCVGWEEGCINGCAIEGLIDVVFCGLWCSRWAWTGWGGAGCMVGCLIVEGAGFAGCVLDCDHYGDDCMEGIMPPGV